ncbi:hypothetical protein [Anatilimnocola floriformis]|uniref:hypothetical protein n=1 Tax=Anatilimnocola floriformis TaxID=2948575 RepID=UPI0020C5928F|nr:hypothetical protein [Anatilimnocola floriformis]
MSLSTWARSLFSRLNRVTRESRARRSQTRFRPRAESLESRLNMAGSVIATAVGGTLFITGDDLANELRIEGVTAGTVEVHGVNTTKVNGVDGGEFTAQNIQNIFMEMGNGDDKATFVLTDVSGLLRFNGGNGKDSLLFGEGNGGTNKFGSLAAAMGAGDDLIVVDRAETSFEVPGAVVISNGEGLNNTILTATNTVVLGPTSITGGALADNIQIGNESAVVTTGQISVNGANGDNQFYLQAKTAVVNGGISLLGGTGADSYYIGVFTGDYTVNGSVTASLGDGQNLLWIGPTEVTVTGLVSFVGGAGSDTFQLDIDEADLLAVSLSLGAGTNAAYMDNLFGGTTLIRSSLTVTSQGNTTINTAGLDVSGATLLTLGDGTDLIQLDNSRFRSVVTISTGGGRDRVLLERGFNDGIGLHFDSVVSIDLGAGDDELAVGRSAMDFATFASLIANGGAGTDTFTDSPFNVYATPRTLISFP